MGFVKSLGGNLLGAAGSALGISGESGRQFRATPAQVLQGVNTDQTGQSFNEAQSGISQQQSFLNALAAQNGLGNQANVFAQQQALADQLQGVANGTGPNPALMQLQNTTGQNVANQAALMAGQRGVGANVGLAARQNALNGANIQQQAVGQGAALQAQQQIAGMNALQQQQGMMGNLANTQVGQQAQGLSAYNQAAQNEQNMMLNALANYNQANIANQSNVNNVNSGVNKQIAQGQQALVGGIESGFSSQAASSALSENGGGGGGGAGAAVGALAKAKGGLVEKYEDGGMVQSPLITSEVYLGGPQSFAGKFLKDASANKPSTSPYNINSGADYNPGANSMFEGTEGLTKVFSKRLFSNGGSFVVGEELASEGKMVPGKAKVKGDSYANDTVNAKLSPGEVVIPRHVMQSSDPVQNAAKFVAAVLAKQGKGIRGSK